MRAAAARPITAVMVSAASAHGFAVGFFAVEVWFFLVLVEISTTFKGNGFFA